MSWWKVVLGGLVACLLCFVVGVVVGGCILYEHDKEVAAKAKASAVQAAQIEYQRRADKQTEIAKDAETQRSKALGDAFVARAQSDGLRRELAAYAGRYKASNPATTGGGAATGDALDLLTDLLGQSVGNSQALAEYADRARIAGQACERSYNALTAK